MTGPITKEQIHSALKDVGLTKIDRDILTKCVALASANHISARQMADSFEAFSLNKNDVTELTSHTFESYRLQLMQTCGGGSAGAIQTRHVKRENPSTSTPAMITPTSNKRGKTTTSTSSSVDSVARSDTTSPERPSSSPSSQQKPIKFTSNVVKYEHRTDAGTVVTAYAPSNNTISSAKTNTTASNNNDRHDHDGRCIISNEGLTTTNVEKPYRYMFTTIQDRSAALESHLVDTSQNIIDKLYSDKGAADGENENDLSPLEQVNVPRQDMVCCVGRICNEAHEGKLNKTSVVLEGSSTSSGGARINVDLTRLESGEGQQGTSTPPSYSIFPGQIVAIEGFNLTGRKLVAHNIYEGVPHQPNESSIKQLSEFHYNKQNGQPIKVVTANGPFTTSDNMSYNPLIDLISGFLDDDNAEGNGSGASSPPDVVILTGPFVDARQELIQNGTVLNELDDDGTLVVASYEAFFANKISSLLQELINHQKEGGNAISTQFVLVPSLDDAVSKGVYPQPPFQNNPYHSKMMDMGLANLLHKQSTKQDGKTNGENGRVHCLSNPCTFKINEVVFGVTSTDILFHMSTEEIHHNLPPNTRLRRIGQHVLQQRSYYPLFPPPAHSLTNIDLKHIDQWKLPCRPDVLILPSKLKAMATTDLLDGSTVIVNPGCLTRATSGGTYAVMEIHPFRKEILDNATAAGGDEDEVRFPHKVNDRINVTVKRI